MNKHKKLPRGTLTAQITPMHNGKPDLVALIKMLERQIEAGIPGILICGTTGEASTLTDTERREVITTARRIIPKSVHLCVGSGVNDTSRTVEYSIEAEALGADSLLLVTPYYNKGTETGIIYHYEKICNTVSLPIVVYNVPTRTGVDLSLETYRRICEADNVCGIKEASPSIDKLALVIREFGKYINVYSGNDMHYLPALTLDGDGVISVASNALPQNMVRICNHFDNGDISSAVRENMRLVRLFSLMFKETSPAPIKYICEKMGLCTSEMRLPMSEVEARTKTLIDNEMSALGMI